MTRHQAITEQRELVELAALAEELQISETIRVAVEDHLPSIATLRNMVRDIGHHNASQASQ